MLPWAGLGLCLVGIVRLYENAPYGAWLVLAGIAAIALDIVIDFVWAHPDVSRSDQPDLNKRGTQCVGRLCLLEEPIIAGRGKVRIGDTLWPVEGLDAAAGTQVRVTASEGTVLRVERA